MKNSEKIDNLFDTDLIILDIAKVWQFIAKHFASYAQYLPFFFQNK